MRNPTQRARPRRVTAREAEALVREQVASGETIAAFARRHGVAAHRLYEARSRLARRRNSAPSTGDFQEVRLVDADQECRGPVELMLPAGLSIRVRRDFDQVALRRLLEVLVSC